MSPRSVPRYGITLPTSGVPLGQMSEWVRAAADSGYTDLWLGESFGGDAVALLAMASAVAPELHLGTAVLPASTRTPGLLAQSAATLAGLAPGRVSIGLGASSPLVVSGGGGTLPERPLAHIRGMVRFLRRALAGERVTESYESFTVTGFALAEPPVTVPPLLVAGLRPAMLQMAAAEADGAVLTLVSAADIARVRGVVGSSFPLVAWLLVCPYDDPAEVDRVRHAARRLLAGYLTVPAYSAAADWHGRGEALSGMRTEWAAGRRREAVAAIPDSVVDELVIHGAPEYCRERIAGFVEAGVQVPLLSAIRLDGDVMAAVTRLAPR
jgi:probable F420-dependent oxidoreductase